MYTESFLFSLLFLPLFMFLGEGWDFVVVVALRESIENVF